MAVFKIGSTAMQGLNKAGTLKPDEAGWYDVYLGALEFPNSTGATYDVGAAQNILRSSCLFTRRLKQGRLFGELGHPRQAPGMKDQAFLARVLDIVEQNESHSIKEVFIDTTAKDKHGRSFIAFRGKIKPSGPYANVTQQKIDDPDMNLCFSIRSFTSDRYENGRVKKSLGTIVTFDQVGEPGIDVADKYNAPSLECYEVEINSSTVEEVLSNPRGYSAESAEILAAVEEIRTKIKQEVPTINYTPDSIGSTPAWAKSWSR